MMTNDTPAFATEQDAADWMYAQIDEWMDGAPTNDQDYTFAFKDDAEGMAKFDEMERCCGVFESEVIVGGREAVIGCTYDH